MLRLKKDTSPDADPAVMPVVADSDAAEGGIALQKKRLPPAALIGIAVGALALAGLAAYLLTRPKEEPEDTAIATLPTRRPAGGNTTMMPGGVTRPGTLKPGVNPAPGVPGTAPGRPKIAQGMPGVTTAVSPGGSTPGMTRSKMTTPGAVSPGGSMPATSRPSAATAVAPPVPVISAAPVRPGPGAPPTLAPPSAPYRPMMTPLTPTLKAQLDLLWKRGADAKHNGDYQAARGYWKQALRLRPGHPGFAEAIRKLPTRQGRRTR